MADAVAQSIAEIASQESKLAEEMIKTAEADPDHDEYVWEE